MSSLFDALEAQLSPEAKHAMQAYKIGFTQGDPTMTVRELREAIRKIYGQEVDQELSRHLSARVNAVLPPRPD